MHKIQDYLANIIRRFGLFIIRSASFIESKNTLNKKICATVKNLFESLEEEGKLKKLTNKELCALACHDFGGEFNIFSKSEAIFSEMLARLDFFEEESEFDGANLDRAAQAHKDVLKFNAEHDNNIILPSRSDINKTKEDFTQRLGETKE